MSTRMLIFSISLLLSMGVVGQSKQEKKAQKKALELKAYQDTRALIETTQYTFESDWATANRGRRINLIGNSNYLRIQNDSVYAYLPFFGERYSGGGYGDSGPIEIAELIENYKVELCEKKNRIDIKFSSKNQTERFEIQLTIFGGNNGTVYVSSNQRSRMNYDGEFGPIRTEEKKTKNEE